MFCQECAASVVCKVLDVVSKRWRVIADIGVPGVTLFGNSRARPLCRIAGLLAGSRALRPGFRRLGGPPRFRDQAAARGLRARIKIWS